MGELNDAANTPVGAEPPAIWDMRAESMVLKVRRRILLMLNNKSPMASSKLRRSLSNEHRAVFEAACRQLEDGGAIWLEEVVYRGQLGKLVHLAGGAR